MAMLAEPRRKQKWSVDPRNSAWSKDESKFGQKMLERMGWSKGKGLGKSEQGSTEHIKVKVKNNNLGVGMSANHEDNWIAHQDDFNQLLAELNSCHGQSSPSAPQEHAFSLEEKSKTSKKRVHYMKFTKGKDLSSRSQTDLACIFGKRAQHKPDQEEESSDQDSQEEQEIGEVQAVTSDPAVETQINTVTSSLTMQEYFAQRMSQLRGALTPVTTPKSTHLAPTATPDMDSHTPDAPPPHHAPDAPAPVKAKSKKKKKKKEMQEEEGEGERVGADMEDRAVSHEAEQESCVVRKKKRRKRADGGMQREECGASCESPPIQPDHAHTAKRKRSDEEQKKKKDKKKRKEK